MDPLDCPFRTTADLLARYRLGTTVTQSVADIHAEADRRKKMANAHVSTARCRACGNAHALSLADAQCVCRGGTAFQSDAGMCGDYDSVIGMTRTTRPPAFWRKMHGERRARPKVKPPCAEFSWNGRHNRPRATDRAGPHRRAIGSGDAARRDVTLERR